MTTDSLSPLDVLAAEIADDLETASELFTKIAVKLSVVSAPRTETRARASGPPLRKPLEVAL